MFGTLIPLGQFGDSYGLSLQTLASGLAGQLLDRDFGLLAVAPYWLMAIPAFFSLNREHRQYGRFAAAAVVGTWLLGVTQRQLVRWL